MKIKLIFDSDNPLDMDEYRLMMRATDMNKSINNIFEYVKNRLKREELSDQAFEELNIFDDKLKDGSLITFPLSELD